MTFNNRPRFFAPHGDAEDIGNWRQHVLSILLSVVLIFGTVVAIPSVLFALVQDQLTIALIDTIALAWIYFIWFRRALTYRARAWNFCALLYTLGAGLLFSVGPTAQYYILAVPVMTALLLGFGPAMMALAVNALTFLLIGYFANADFHVPGVQGQPLMAWTIITINFIFVDSMMTISTVILLAGLEASLERSRERQELYLATFEHAPIGVARFDVNGRWLQVNEKMCDITGYARAEMLQLACHALAHPEDAELHIAEITNLVAGKMARLEREIRYVRKDGAVVWVQVHSSVMRSASGTAKYGISVVTDIAQRKAAEDQIHTLAYYDSLTKLPNRRMFVDRLTHALAVSARTRRQGAIMFIDLDHFKTLNDIQGHDVGDRLLAEVALRLQETIRQGDTVARMGGDDFVLMLEDLPPDDLVAAHVEAVARKILAEIDRPYRLELKMGEITHNTIEYHCTASIGIALFGAQQENVDDLLKQADLAMYQAKDSGRNSIRFFDTGMQAKVTARAALADDLRDAIRHGEFMLYYQPQVSGQGRLTGAEALVRWQHPQRGIVSPADFILLAEETGLILPLGQWVLQTACRQLAVWALAPPTAHLTIAVNVSPRQFTQAAFVDQVLEVLAETNANPQRLKLELTESLLILNVDDVIEKMSALKERGVGFSLDDFGTGYSSLSYLKLLPLDQLKIDQAFVRDVLVDANDAAIAKTIVALSRSLALDVIAEGVETAAQRDFLADCGCLAYQGYFFGRPVPIGEFELFARTDWLRQIEQPDSLQT